MNPLSNNLDTDNLKDLITNPCCKKLIENLSLNQIFELKLFSFLDKIPEGVSLGLFPLVVSIVEKSIIQNTLIKTKGNQTQAAEILGINRNTLRKKIAELKLDVSLIKSRAKEDSRKKINIVEHSPWPPALT